MTEVIMPKMGDAMEEGVLLEWLKKDGDKVKSGEPIGTIQTDKATLELESPGSGTLTGFLVKGGETVPVGKPIAAIVKEGENLPGDWSLKGPPADAANEPGVQPPSAKLQPEQPIVPDEGKQPDQGRAPAPPQPEPAARAEQPGSEQPAPPRPNGLQPAGEARVIASPLARKIAAEKGVDLASIQGTGPGGRIIEKDVLEANPSPLPAPPPEPRPASPPIPQIGVTGEDHQVKLTRLRQITAERTLQSKQQAPHFYVTVEVDVEKILDLKAQFEAEASGKISINDFVVRACVLALQEMPQVNAVFQGDHVTEFGAVHIGMAVAVEDGLTVPVIKNAHQMTLRQISAASKELARKARDNKLHLDELSGSTFSISNMGMLDVDDFVAIINQPNAAILAVSSARRKVVVAGNENADPLASTPEFDEEGGLPIEIRHRMNISGSFDHRVVDGAIGAKFMNVIRGYLENPTRLMS